MVTADGSALWEVDGIAEDDGGLSILIGVISTTGFSIIAGEDGELEDGEDPDSPLEGAFVDMLVIFLVPLLSFIHIANITIRSLLFTRCYFTSMRFARSIKSIYSHYTHEYMI